MIAAELLFLLTAAAAVDPEVKVEHDLAYLAEDRAEKLDLYMPAKVDKGQRCPGIVIIHGGGWTGGSKRGAREQNIGTTLAKNGYVCISIDYVLATKDKSTWPQNLHDCKTAVRWLRANAEKYHVDADHIGVIGGSAGGHLALMVGLTDPEAGLDPKEPHGKLSCRVQAVVDLYGPADLVHRGKDLAMLPGTLADKPDLYKRASPVTHVRKGNPPVLILHGSKDSIVPVEQSKLMADALKKAGVEHELIVVEGAGHSFHLEPKEKDLRPAVLGFFDKHLKPTVAPNPLDKLKKLGARIQLDDKKRVIAVNLGERRITDADLIHLKGLEHLQELDLTRTAVTSAGLVNLKDLTTLKKLYLTETKVDDEGIANLKGLKALEMLGLSGTRIGDPALSHLTALTELTSLFCLSTRVTDAGVEKLQKALPKCLIAS